MDLFLIGYDLVKEGQNYDGLIQAIKSLPGTGWHHLDSTWVLRSSGTAPEIRDILVRHLGPNDKLLVVQLTGEGAWSGFNDEGSQWLMDNL